jgi:hypothetical protein
LPFDWCGRGRIVSKNPQSSVFLVNTAHCLMTISRGHELNDCSQGTQRRASSSTVQIHRRSGP